MATLGEAPRPAVGARRGWPGPRGHWLFGCVRDFQGDMLNFPYGGSPFDCCGFYQPTQDLVNSYRTDANGLPLLDTYNQNAVKSDQGISSASRQTQSVASSSNSPLDSIASRTTPSSPCSIAELSKAGSSLRRNQLHDTEPVRRSRRARRIRRRNPTATREHIFVPQP